MATNLVSEQLPAQSIQIDQLEQISDKLDSPMQVGLMGPATSNSAMQHMSLPNMQMDLLGLGRSGAQPQQISLSNSHVQYLESMSHGHAMQKLSRSDMHIGEAELQSYNQMSQQYFLSNQQTGETLSNNVGSQHASSLNKRKAAIQPTSGSLASPNYEVSNKRVAQAESRPWLQPISMPNTVGVPMQSVSNTSPSPHSQIPLKRSFPIKNVPHQSSLQRNHTGQIHPSPKAQNESLEAVRSKLRESLAAALDLVFQEKDKILNAEGHLQNEAKEMMDATEDSFGRNYNSDENRLHETANSNTGVSVQTSKSDGDELRSSVILNDGDVSLGDTFFVKDELLQGNGLSWVLESDTDLTGKKDTESAQKLSDQQVLAGEDGRSTVPTPQVLASKIEEELFKLFGGVNKKYKEKGRSLLFNLKDRNNPDLREKVMSGEIPPKRLCSMSAEELASKELSEWRMAKAEELAQMVVLPDSDVDIRRLVKKTHKGEFQVEVEQDSVSVEVAVGTSSLTNAPPKLEDKKASPSLKLNRAKDKHPRKADQPKPKTKTGRIKNNIEDHDESCTITIPYNEGSDLMQGFMVDDVLKDTEFLPPIVSLDEFMESLNTEPPFEHLPGDAGKTAPASDKDDSVSKLPDVSPEDHSDTMTDKHGIEVMSPKVDASREHIESFGKSERTPSVGFSKDGHVWQGLLQLNVSATASVIGIYRSGEKTSTKNWSDFIEIKGRVRLDAFEKFLQELPMSRSRAIMVVHFVCKEDSQENERASVRELVDSYVLDGRVGLAEPARGVELYTCPPDSKTREMLSKVLPKDQLDGLNAIDNGLIGVIVWRKPQRSISPNSASHNKHNSKKHLSSRRHQEKESNVNVNMTPKNAYPRDVSSSLPKPQPQPQTQTQIDVDEDDDVPPGFGPPSTRDDDDLPEFNFSNDSSTPRPPLSTHSPNPVSGMAPFNPMSRHASRPVDQMRELVQRYGQSGTSGIGIEMQPWNDDDDDMPEWRPEHIQQRPHGVSVQLHGRQQPVLRAHMVQQTPPLPTPTSGMSRVSVIHDQQNVASWQHASRMVPPFQQTSGGQLYGSSGHQQGSGWPRDPAKSRGL
ncbi:hypothetical protein K2173_026120 [Erythroxylum novogranatense]|uniref:TFIIS central domain-containing protein n=1 Tax=Erythroxylum novogranatense TaxID=1862640 RepID=A0AAV8SIT6_9ROSI|nr:hypothetical protein K2173_026120 [Erythroxylum novogranatense]